MPDAALMSQDRVVSQGRCVYRHTQEIYCVGTSGAVLQCTSIYHLDLLTFENSTCQHISMFICTYGILCEDSWHRVDVDGDQAYEHCGNGGKEVPVADAVEVEKNLLKKQS